MQAYACANRKCSQDYRRNYSVLCKLKKDPEESSGQSLDYVFFVDFFLSF